MRVEFFFDCSSPWTYLAFDRIGPLCRELKVELVYRPVLVGGVFNQVNSSVYESRQNPVPAKARYFRDDLQLWAEHQNLKIDWPEVFPVNSVKAMRGAFLAIERGCLEPYARRVFELYWGRGRDISREDVLLEALAELPMDEAEFLAWCGSDEARSRLRTSTQELIDRGGFGSPTMYLNERVMLFGNDRMELLRAQIARLSG